MENQKPETWFQATEVKARGRKMRAPYDKIVIGCDPVDGMTPEAARSFDAIVNVSCSPCAYFYPSFPGQYMHWYPINEMGQWPLSAFYWIKHVLDFHYERGHRVYLHCHAGAYRSPTFGTYWLVSRGHSLDEAIEIELNDDAGVQRRKKEEGGLYWKYRKEFPYKEGNIKVKQVLELFKRMREHPTYSYGSIIHNPPIAPNAEICGRYRWAYRLDQYLWWYRRPMYWLSRRVDYAMYYVRGSKIDRPPSQGGWHITQREDKLARVCQWIDRKKSRCVYRLSKVSLKIFADNWNRNPSISLS